MRYTRDSVKAPRVSGVALKAFVSALESAVGPVIINKLITDSGIARFRETSAGSASPIQVPLPLGPAPRESADGPTLAKRALEAPAPASVAKLETAASFRAAYQSGGTDPVRVVRKLHDAILKLEGGDETMNFFISRKPEQVLAEAEASTARWRAGTPKSVLDGIPVVLKDEIDLEGFVTTLGTKFRDEVATHDSAIASRLKAAGALILGKANMNEIGISPVGLNPHYGPPRNPFDRARITGGSSSGSAGVVAAGLCPISLGADGGGSIRIPAALCGVVGLKATFGRVSEAGIPALCWNVGHAGPLGLTVSDVAAAYAIIAGPDVHDPASLPQPPLHLTDYENGNLTGVRLGICNAFFDDADPDVVMRCREALKVLTDAGATVVEVPPPDLNLVLWSHSIIILTEMLEAMHDEVWKDSTRFALDSRTNLAIGANFSSRDYVHAMRHRQRMTRELLEVMHTCDVVVTPTTACTAPLIPESTLPDGESNLPVVDQLMRFIRLGNLTGFPALSVPVGLDALGLPVGLQLMGRPYEEHLLLRLGRVIEAAVPRAVPRVHVTALH